MKKRAVELISTVGYVGRIPWAPGTFGSVVGVLLAFALSYFGLITYFVVTIVLIAVGIWAAGQYETLMGRHDPKEIVIDEVVGYLVTVFMVLPTWQNLLIGFVIFRFFDILKPWPISWLDRKVPGGIGTVIDDLAAGLIGLLVMQLIIARYSFYF